MTNSSRNFFFH